ncbi:MAG: PKD domain-containing protein [Bacteroidetes bacterium]|nr:PKD domain-containing protein [Bacteroidota bacterium]
MKSYSYIVLPVIIFFSSVFFGVHAQDIQTENLELLPFNIGDADEFAPVFYRDGIVFASNRKSDLVICYSDTTGKHLTDIYYVKAKDSVKFALPSILAPELTTAFHEGPACFTADGNKIFYTRNLETPKKSGRKKTGDNRFGIYTAELMDGVWQNIQPFKYNDAGYNTGHASISPDGKNLFFVSDREGGSGGSDIWSCNWIDTAWSKPENMGRSVNTPGREVFPFIHESGRLYFASDGNNGAGGLDLYYTIQKDGRWQKPKALASPYNSQADDFGYLTDALFRDVYFTSNREGTDDIYRVRSTMPDFGFCDTMQLNDYCYVFFEDGPMQLDTTTLEYEWDFGDGSKLRNIEAEHCFEGPGTYTVQLNVIDTATGEIYSRQAVYELLIEDIIQPYINCPDTSITGRQIVFDARATNLPGYEIEGYFWDFGEGNRKQGESVTFTYDEPGKRTVQLGIIASGITGEKKRFCVVKDIDIIERRPQ